MLPEATVFPLKNADISFEGIQINIMRFSRISDENQWSIPLHAHENYEFHFIYDGKGTIQLGDKILPVQKNQFYVCSPFMQHSQTANHEDPMKEYCIECKLSFDKGPNEESETEYYAQLTNRLYFTCFDEGKNNPGEKFCELDEILSRKGNQIFKGEQTYIKSILLSIILQYLILLKQKFIENMDERLGDINHQRAISIKNYLDANLLEDITIQDCAKTFCLSERQIDRIMKAEYNDTFYQYLMRLRVNVAATLVSTTSYSFDEIAEKSGFSGYRQMLRNFTRFDMKCPSAYRREIKRKELEERKKQNEAL